MSIQSKAATDKRQAAPSTSAYLGRARAAGRLNAAALVPWAVVLLAPVLGIVLLRAPLLNAFGYNCPGCGYLDQWLYSGYGWSLAHHVAIFGWYYYVDRFTVVLPIAVSTGLLGPVAGYLVLHYVLMAGCGALLYLAVRRYASMPVGVAAVCLLMLNPFFVRLVTWDYVTFVTLPCTIAGAALWFLGSTRSRALWTALGAGICLSAAVYANPLSGLVLPALIGVEAIAAIRGGRREVMTLVLRGSAMAAGALLVLVVGYLGYRAYIGPFPLKMMFQATIDFIRANSQNSAVYQVPPRVWLRADPSIYAPLLVCVGTIVVLARSLLSNTLRARMAQFAIAYTLLFWVFRFVVTSSLIETWFYYNLTAVTPAFAMPAILDELGRRCGRARWLVVALVAIAAAGLTDLVIRSMSESALNILNTRLGVLLGVSVACCVAALLVVVLKRDAARLIAVAVFCAIVAAIALVPDKQLTPTGQCCAAATDLTGNFSTVGTTAQLAGYQASYDMTQLIAKYDRPSSRVVLWDALDGFGAAGWVDLWAHLDAAAGYPLPPLPVLVPPDLAMLGYPTTRVLAVAESIPQVAGAVPALEKAGLDPSLETEGVWAGGRLYYALIKLRAS